MTEVCGSLWILATVASGSALMISSFNTYYLYSSFFSLWCVFYYRCYYYTISFIEHSKCHRLSLSCYVYILLSCVGVEKKIYRWKWLKRVEAKTTDVGVASYYYSPPLENYTVDLYCFNRSQYSPPLDDEVGI